MQPPTTVVTHASIAAERRANFIVEVLFYECSVRDKCVWLTGLSMAFLSDSLLLLYAKYDRARERQLLQSFDLGRRRAFPVNCLTIAETEI